MDDFISWFMVGLGFIVLGFIMGSVTVRHGFQDTAATYECAQYNPTTGEFEWIVGEK